MPILGGVSPTANDGIGVLLVQGSLDGRATPADGLATYDRIATGPRAYVEIEGTNHYGLTDDNPPPTALGDLNDPTLDQDVALAAVARWFGLFLRATVLDDGAAHRFVFENGGEPGITVTAAP